MASSTTKPVETVSAISERLSSEKPKQQHHPQRAQQRDGDGDAGDQHRPAVHQEEGDDADHQQGGDEHRPLDVGQRGADGGRAVDREVHLDVLRQRALDRRQARLHRGRRWR